MATNDALNALLLLVLVNRGLMAKEDLSNLGLGANQEYKRGPSNEGKREGQYHDVTLVM